jgi:hypothetical protein
VITRHRPCPWLSLAAGALTLAACGRIGFDPFAAGGDGGASGGDGGGVSTDALGAPSDGAPPVPSDGAVTAPPGDGMPPPLGAPALCVEPVLVAAGTSPSLAFSDGEYGIAYLSGSEVRFARVSIEGIPAANTTHLYTGGTGFDLPGTVSLTWAGNQWVAAFDGLGVHVARIDAAGLEIGAEIPIDAATNAGIPTVGFDGNQLGLAWTSHDGQEFQVYFAQLAANGALASPSKVTNNGYSSFQAALAWTGADWGLTWADSIFRMRCVSHGVWFQRITADGRISGGSAQVLETVCDNSGNTIGHEPVLAWNGAEHLVAWRDARSGNNDIYLGRVDAASGALVAPDIRVSTDAAQSLHPSLAWTGRELGLAWYGEGIHFVRTDAAGALLSTETVIPGTATGTEPSLVWDGSRYAVAWEMEGGIYFAAICLPPA